MSSFTDYLVVSTICPEGVRRRYSDFDWLRSLLSERYSGVAIPLMPEKRVMNQDQAFIEERMSGLYYYMLLLLSNPYVRNDSSLKMFLTLKGTSDFDQAKKAANAGMGADPNANPGLARWFGVLRSLPVPVDCDQACNELISATDEMEVRVVASLGAVTRFHDACKAYSDSLKAISDSLLDWSNESTTSSTGMSNTMTALKVNTSKLGERLKKVGLTFKEAHDLAVFSPNEVSIFLVDGLVTELHRLKSLRDLMKKREEAQTQYGNAWKAKEQLDVQLKSFKEKGRVDLAASLEPKLAKAAFDLKSRKERLVVPALAFLCSSPSARTHAPPLRKHSSHTHTLTFHPRLDDISKGALFIESDKCSRSRLARFVAMVGQYAALSIASGSKNTELWTKFLAVMELSQNNMITDAQATLTGSSSMHGMDCIAGSNLSLPAPSNVLEGNGGSVGGGAASTPTFSVAPPAPAQSAPPPPPPPAFEQAAPASPPPVSVSSMFTSSPGETSAPPAFFGGGSTVDL